MKRPKLVTSALITHGCKVLMIKRKKAPESNKWAFPGGVGSFEKFADPKLAVQDEVKFDLGVDFNVDSFYDYSFYADKQGHSIVLHYLGKISGAPTPNETEVVELKYISEEDFENMSEEDFAFDHYEILKNYFKSIPKIGVSYLISS